MNQIIIGYTTEGTTDIRFLESIIERTFVEVALECESQIEVITPIVLINKTLGKSFEENVLCSAKEAAQYGVLAFCVHVDADSHSDEDVFNNKVSPAIVELQKCQDEACMNIVPIIPIQMTESWMLADKDLLKEEMGTNLSDITLKINRDPETIAQPKDVISEAIGIARNALTRKRRHQLTISELYLPIGQKLQLQKLESIASYCKFKESVRDAYRKLNYLT